MKRELGQPGGGSPNFLWTVVVCLAPRTPGSGGIREFTLPELAKEISLKKSGVSGAEKP